MANLERLTCYENDFRMNLYSVLCISSEEGKYEIQ